MIAVEPDRTEHDAGQFCSAWPHPSLMETGVAEQGEREGEGAAGLALCFGDMSPGVGWRGMNKKSSSYWMFCVFCFVVAGCVVLGNFCPLPGTVPSAFVDRCGIDWVRTMFLFSIEGADGSLD